MPGRQNQSGCREERHRSRKPGRVRLARQHLEKHRGVGGVGVNVLSTVNKDSVGPEHPHSLVAGSGIGLPVELSSCVFSSNQL